MLAEELAYQALSQSLKVVHSCYQLASGGLLLSKLAKGMISSYLPSLVLKYIYSLFVYLLLFLASSQSQKLFSSYDDAQKAATWRCRRNYDNIQSVMGSCTTFLP